MGVFPWLLAAPAGYDYGTKIHFKWYGVWQVEDRWGAIVRSGVRWYEHDRIDIWMWYGDEGLNRALRWWKRTIAIIDFQIKTGIINNRNHSEAWYFGNKTRTALRENFDFWPLSEEAVELYDGATAPAPLTQEQKTIVQYDGLEVSPESSSEQIERLQRLFSEVWLYKWTIDGNYSSIEWSLLSFQIWAGIVDDKDDWWAGYYGEKTRKALFEYFASSNSNNITRVSVQKNLETTLSVREIKELDALIVKLKKEVKKIADAKNTFPSNIYRQLSQRIDTLLKRNISDKLKEKLKYIQKNI